MVTSMPDSAVVPLKSDVAVVDVSAVITPSSISRVGKQQEWPLLLCRSCLIFELIHQPLDRISVGVVDKMHAASQLSAMLLLGHAGEEVELAFLLTNTGNVTITNLIWDVPSAFEFVPYGCALNMQPHNAFTTTLLPGAALQCKAYHKVTLEELEGSEYKVTVLATDEGTSLNVFKDLMVYSKQLPQVSVQVSEQHCSQMPAVAGALMSWSQHRQVML
jgi:hypothetical protein